MTLGDKPNLKMYYAHEEAIRRHIHLMDEPSNKRKWSEISQIRSKYGME